MFEFRKFRRKFLLENIQLDYVPVKTDRCGFNELHLFDYRNRTNAKRYRYKKLKREKQLTESHFSRNVSDHAYRNGLSLLQCAHQHNYHCKKENSYADS